MASTLADLAITATTPMEKGVIKRFAQQSSFIRQLPQVPISGPTYIYRVEESLPGVAFRDVNEAYVESTGTFAKRIEETKILGGDVFTDNALLKNQRTGGDAFDLEAEQFDLKARALARELERCYFEGDDIVNPKELPGLRRRLSGSQVVYASATAGTALALTHVDALIDAVDRSIGTPHIFSNKQDCRAMTRLVQGLGGSVVINYDSLNDMGPMIESYFGVPWHIVEDGWDGSTVLAKDEWPGSGSANTSSIYCVIFDEALGCHGVISGGGSDPLVSVRRVGETTGVGQAPGILGRIETYVGLVLKSPRCAARLRNVA